jgi:hypothetical protein
LDWAFVTEGFVLRRRVHYFSGFDPRGAAYYHRLCEEEAAKPQVQGGTLSVGRRRRMGKLFNHWMVTWQSGGKDAQSVETQHVFMSWDDIIRSNWSKSPWALFKEFWLAYRGIIFDVDLSRVKQIFEGVYMTGVLPGAYLLGSLLLGVLLSIGLLSLSTLMLGPQWLQWAWQVFACLSGAGLVVALGVYGEHRGLFWLLRIFTYVIRMGRRGIDGAEQRTQQWVEHVIQRQQEDPVDEVLLVGHSIGTLMMVGAVDALLQDPRWQALHQGRKTKVLTLGQCYPFIAMVPRSKAQLFKEALQRLSFHANLLWWDVTAKIDPLCFYRAHPLVKTDVDHSKAPMPVLHSASFFKMYTPQSWVLIRQNKLDAHFLYLRAPELAGNFNLFDVLYGPNWFEHHVGRVHD